MRAGTSLRTAVLAVAALALAAGTALASGGPSCTITGKEFSCSNEQICGPEGNYSYYWARPFGGIEFTRCITAIEEGGYILWITDLSTGLQGEPCFFKFTKLLPPDCSIKGPDDFCAGTKATLCGPDGMASYAWSGPGNFSGTTQCVDVTVGGTYTLTITNFDGCSSTCKKDISTKICIINCPRTVGYWGAQCAQKQNGSTKFTVPQVTSIAQCVDGRSAFFNWGSSAFDKFCSVISSSKTDQRSQAKRQYAGLLANICTGELGLVANNGDKIKLSTETIVSCGGTTQSIGDLIASIDAQLAALESKSLSLAWVKATYSAIIGCADDINNGRGIGLVCPELQSLTLTSISTGTALSPSREAQPDGMTSDLALGTLRAYPNPFAGVTRLAYAVAPQGEHVSLGVYDIAGRQVKVLFNGFQNGGAHQSQWDGTDASGVRARTGMYFIRGRVGERILASRVMMVK